MEEKKETSFWDEYGKYLAATAGIIFVYRLGIRRGYRRALKDVEELCDAIVSAFEN